MFITLPKPIPWKIEFSWAQARHMLLIPGNQSLISGSYIKVEGENGLSKIDL